jgi:ribosome-interacting GTPase 1
LTVAVTGTSTVCVTGVHRKQPNDVGVCTLTVCVTGTMSVCETAQLTTLRAWPGVENVTGVQSIEMFPTGISR